MKIDLTNVKVVPTLGAEPAILSDAKDLVANKCYQSATEVWQDDLAHRIYHSDGVVELEPREADYIREVLARTGTPLFIRKPIVESIIK